VIPPEVHGELLAVDAPPVVRAWAQNLPPWIEVRSPGGKVATRPKLGRIRLRGRAAIVLAIDLGSAVLLIDERAGSTIARGLGLPVTVTLGVLDEAARQHLISLPDAIERLKHTSFRYPKAIVAKLLEEDASRS